jgi:hypothetical protein
MPNVIINWFRRRRVARSNRKQRALSASTTILKEALPIPPHPQLPSQRGARLTPTSSHESLIRSSNAATADSSFFTKLPLEIRRKILREAFGGQTVHMDLIYDHPLLPPEDQPDDSHEEPSKRRSRPHGNLNVNINTCTCDIRNLRLDDSRPKEWAWRSSVCHRNPPARCAPGQAVQPAEDYCRFGQTPWQRTCLVWPGEFPTKCLIGAMGWLCSCRQA